MSPCGRRGCSPAGSLGRQMGFPWVSHGCPMGPGSPMGNPRPRSPGLTPWVSYAPLGPWWHPLRPFVGYASGLPVPPCTCTPSRIGRAGTRAGFPHLSILCFALSHLLSFPSFPSLAFLTPGGAACANDLHAGSFFFKGFWRGHPRPFSNALIAKLTIFDRI